MFNLVKRAVWEQKRRKLPANSLSFATSSPRVQPIFTEILQLQELLPAWWLGHVLRVLSCPGVWRSQLRPGTAGSSRVISKSRKISTAFGGLWIGSCTPGMAESRKAVKTRCVSGCKLLRPGRALSWSLNFCKNLRLGYWNHRRNQRKTHKRVWMTLADHSAALPQELSRVCRQWQWLWVASKGN